MWLPLGILNFVNAKNLVLNTIATGGQYGLHISSKNEYTYLITKKEYSSVELTSTVQRHH